MHEVILVRFHERGNESGNRENTRMKYWKRTETTIETHEFWTIGRLLSPQQVRCDECEGSPDMITPEQAAVMARVTLRVIYRWVEDATVHFTETTDGRIFVCLADKELPFARSNQ